MQNRIITIALVVALLTAFTNCANRGTPSGGDKDIVPPKITKSKPENYTTNFKGNEILIYFDEYIKIKNLTKQLIISPPMKNMPEITPLGSASKFIKIRIFDTLQPNTTYAFNFGNSIVDNNEGNPFTYYTYVFSTGNQIDSLEVKGAVSDALKSKADQFISVVLYEANTMYKDSLVYTDTPKYITNTLDSTTNFTLKNVKAGKYKLIAIKDENQDNKFQQKTDKIGFVEEFITVPNDSFYKIKLFKEAIDYKAKKPRQVAGERIAFGYEGGDYNKTTIELVSNPPKNFKYRIIKNAEKDSLDLFYLPKFEPKEDHKDSLVFKVTNAKVVDTFTVSIRDQYQDSLIVNAHPRGRIIVGQDLNIYANIPFTAIDKEKIKILDKDSTALDFSTTLDTLKNAYALKFDKTEDNVYNINVFPGALTDFFGNTNDTLIYSLQTKKRESFGNARIILKNAKYPVIIQLTNDKQEVLIEKAVDKARPIDFEYLETGKYYLRVVHDTNKNGKYDSGVFLKGIQPEYISYFPVPLDVRPGWDLVEEFTLK